MLSIFASAGSRHAPFHSKGDHRLKHLSHLARRLSMTYRHLTGAKSIQASRWVTLFKRHFSSQFAGSTKRYIASATFAVVLCLTPGFVPASLAQESAKSHRKVLSQVKPEYPETLRNLHIEGMVRLTAIVLPNGSVLAVRVRGGNPILVENAVKAVKSWKYTPAAAQTEEEVVLNFSDR